MYKEIYAIGGTLKRWSMKAFKFQDSRYIAKLRSNEAPDYQSIYLFILPEKRYQSRAIYKKLRWSLKSVGNHLHLLPLAPVGPYPSPNGPFNFIFWKNTHPFSARSIIIYSIASTLSPLIEASDRFSRLRPTRQIIIPLIMIISVFRPNGEKKKEKKNNAQALKNSHPLHSSLNTCVRKNKKQTNNDFSSIIFSSLQKKDPLWNVFQCVIHMWDVKYNNKKITHNYLSGWTWEFRRTKRENSPFVPFYRTGIVA